MMLLFFQTALMLNMKLIVYQMKLNVIVNAVVFQNQKFVTELTIVVVNSLSKIFV